MRIRIRADKVIIQPDKSTSSLYWLAIEFNLGLVAGSMSTLRRLPGLRSFGSSEGGSGYHHDSVELDNVRRRGRQRRIGDSEDPERPDQHSNESQERIYAEVAEREIRKEMTFSIREELDCSDSATTQDNSRR